MGVREHDGCMSMSVWAFDVCMEVWVYGGMGVWGYGNLTTLESRGIRIGRHRELGDLVHQFVDVLNHKLATQNCLCSVWIENETELHITSRSP